MANSMNQHEHTHFTCHTHTTAQKYQWTLHKTLGAYAAWRNSQSAKRVRERKAGGKFEIRTQLWNNYLTYGKIWLFNIFKQFYVIYRIKTKSLLYLNFIQELSFVFTFFPHFFSFLTEQISKWVCACAFGSCSPFESCSSLRFAYLCARVRSSFHCV